MVVIIPDAGPLFSLAAGDLLGLLQRFPLAVTDIVKEETFDKGLLPNCSVEAFRLLEFYNRHAPNIEIIATQVGADVARERKINPEYRQPRHLGELSIQSYLTRLYVKQQVAQPLVLFEDAWFANNAPSLPFGILTSTQAFLVNMEKMKILESADRARAAIAQGRPYASVINVDKQLGRKK